MGLKKEIVELSDGSKIEIKELSYAGQIRLIKYQEEKKYDNFTEHPGDLIDFYLKECLSADDYKKLEVINKNEGLKLQKQIRELNKSEDSEKK